jgi:hypothetical protein
MSALPVLCLACARWHGQPPPGQQSDTCTSFPAGIPPDILVWGADHRTSRAGEPPFELDPARQQHYDDWLRVLSPERNPT